MKKRRIQHKVDLEERKTPAEESNWEKTHFIGKKLLIFVRQLRTIVKAVI